MEAIAILDTVPVIVGVIRFPVLFAATVVEPPEILGAGGVIVTLIFAADDVPPGPVTVTEKLSTPL